MGERHPRSQGSQPPKPLKNSSKRQGCRSIGGEEGGEGISASVNTRRNAFSFTSSDRNPALGQGPRHC